MRALRLQLKIKPLNTKLNQLKNVIFSIFGLLS